MLIRGSSEMGWAFPTLEGSVKSPDSILLIDGLFVSISQDAIGPLTLPCSIVLPSKSPAVSSFHPPSLVSALSALGENPNAATQALKQRPLLSLPPAPLLFFHLQHSPACSGSLSSGLLTDVGTGSDAIAIGIVRNPPCIPSDNISGLQADDGIHEPRLGLDGGASGMDYLLHLYNIAAAMLKPGGMSRLQGPSSLKRKRPEVNSPAQSLTEHERLLYDVIRSKQDIGIWTRDMKKEAKLPDNVVNKSLKALQVKKLIKEVVNIQNKGRKHFMATEFEPSKEISGGAWYLEGSLDTEFIESLKQLCKRQIERRGVATLEEVTDSINSYPAFNVDVTKQQIEEILRTLILDNVIMEVKSNGMGEFASIPFGEVCYKYISKVGLGGEPKAGALASIPCGVCPRISQCTPDGIISPKTCVYYQKWLDF
ncbi:DNA-directed RNA polymerase III subunit RPC6-like isoform X2 [Populus alba x Populus x berolinensis]|nr:DNA-directed RNA polymerase III subunit RPC6-like isoform X2 [Populus alba x Populus x berolinensis]